MSGNGWQGLLLATNHAVARVRTATPGREGFRVCRQAQPQCLMLCNCMPFTFLGFPAHDSSHSSQHFMRAAEASWNSRSGSSGRSQHMALLT